MNIWEPQFIKGDKFFKLFLSHTHRHKKAMADLKLALASYGVAAFVAHEDIEPGRKWQGVIEVALGECDALAAYLTDDFHASPWTDQEVGAVIGRGALVVPIKVDVDPYGFMSETQAIPGAGLEPDGLASRLVRIFETDSRTRQRFAEVVVDRFYHSNTFDDARKNLMRAKELPTDVWTPEMAERVRAATVENDQVTNAHFGFGDNRSTVPAEANALLKSLGFETSSIA